MEAPIVDQNKQQTRAFLRERFLRLMASLNGQKVDINMYEKTKVSGTLCAMDINVQSVQVSNLQTPIGVLPEAVLRVGDIQTISIPEFRT